MTNPIRGWKKGQDYDRILAENPRIAVLALDDEHTPVIVTHKRRNATATFDCADQTGELEGSDFYDLNDNDHALLEHCRKAAEEWFDKARPEGWNG